MLKEFFIFGHIFRTHSHGFFVLSSNFSRTFPHFPTLHSNFVFERAEEQRKSPKQSCQYDIKNLTFSNIFYDRLKHKLNRTL